LRHKGRYGANKVVQILAGSTDFRYIQNNARGLKSRGRFAFPARRAPAIPIAFVSTESAGVDPRACKADGTHR
jgi:hypothetical protein